MRKINIFISSNIEDNKDKYYIMYKIQNYFRRFIELYNKSKNYNFIVREIYYFFNKNSNENKNNLIITDSTKIYKYELEEKICLGKDALFQLFL